jgi:dTDP-4-dehydrorhamnose 3,5-epimerase
VILTPTTIAGAVLIELDRHADERGFFARAWSADELAAAGLVTGIAQCNIAFNERAGTLRGLHFQRPPHEEVKLVRCTRGALHDVIVDLRPDSPTYRGWLAVELTEENRTTLYVPAGCAHGYQTLVDGSEAFYMHSAPHAPEAEDGVRWDDPAFGIAWPDAEPRIMSAKDRSWPDFAPPAQPLDR